MKRVSVLFILLMMISVGAIAQNQQGQSSMGVNFGYGFDTENVTIGLDYRYSITDEFRIAPSITHFAKANHHNAWTIDVNAHYVVQLSDMFGFYPLGGLSLSLWKFDAGKSYSHNYNRFGVNIGLGGEVYATKEITVGLEVKYHIVKTFDQALLAVRVGYNF